MFFYCPSVLYSNILQATCSLRKQQHTVSPAYSTDCGDYTPPPFIITITRKQYTDSRGAGKARTGRQVKPSKNTDT